MRQTHEACCRTHETFERLHEMLTLASCWPAGWTSQSGPWLSRTDQAGLVGKHDGLHAVA